MDDLLKGLTVGLFSLFVIHFGAQDRVRFNAERQVRESFENTGTVRVTVAPRGALGLYASDIWAVDVYGRGQQAARLPLVLSPKPGWKGSIRHLRLHLTDFTLAGLPIERFETDIPFVTYDIGHAAWKGRLVMRDAGSGPASVRVGVDGLRAFVDRKFKSTLSDVVIRTENQRIHLSCTMQVFGPVRLLASGSLTTRMGRYLDITDPVFLANGSPLSAQMTASILQQFNPVLDAEKDLGLEGYFDMKSVEIGEGFVLIRGQASIPTASQVSTFTHANKP